MKTLKRTMSLLLCVCIILSSACGVFAADTQSGSGRTLKILSIGNSFSRDAHRWLYQVAVAAGFEDVVIANLYKSGGPLATHWDYASGDKPNYEYQKNSTGEIAYTANMTMKKALADEEWDYITLQQASGSSGMPDTYNSDLTNLIDYVKSNMSNKNAKLVWHMTWAYQGDSTHKEFVKYNNDQMTMYNSIINTTKSKILTNPNFDFVIPAGTAVQNMRTSFIGDNMTRDGYHMNLMFGRYTLALTWIYSICRDMGLPLPTDITYTPSQTEMPLSYLPAIREAAANAIETPYNVTQSSYKKLPSPADSGEYVLLDWQPHRFGYWNTSSTLAFNRITTGDFDAVNFIASGRRFDKTDIPVGSVICLADGYSYRAEGWQNLSLKPAGNRPEHVTDSTVTVTDEWWGSYNYRAFNLTKTSGDTMYDVTERKAADALKIYVPKTAVKVKENGNSIDSFKINGKDGIIGENAITFIFPEGTDLSSVTPKITFSRGASITPSPSLSQDFSKPVNYKVVSESGHTAIYTVSVFFKKEIDTKEYKLLDWEPMAASFWNSGSNSIQNNSENNNSDNRKNFVSSAKMFTRDDIPVGSIIEIDTGYQYRADAWTELDSKTSPRPGNVSIPQIVVDDEWWGSYNYRAFNVSNIEGTDLTGKTKEASNALRIYVPVDSAK